jgi:hypothetical protein
MPSSNDPPTAITVRTQAPAALPERERVGLGAWLEEDDLQGPDL